MEVFMNKKRKVMKRISAWVMCLAMVLTTINLPAFTTKVKAATIGVVDGLRYELDETEHTAKIILGESGYGSYSGDITIPKTVVYEGKTYTVTSIGTSSFYVCENVTSVTIPDSIITIESRAFYGCKRLGGLTIPESVKSIGEGLFYDCTSLKEIQIPSTITAIESRTFYNCKSLEEIVIPDGVTSIGAYAFYGCSALKEVTIPKNVTSVGESVFSNCSADMVLYVNCSEYLSTIKNWGGGKKGNLINHYGGIATCSSKAICEGCGNEYGELDSEVHDLSSYKIDSLTHAKQCSDCGYVVSEKEAHEYVDGVCKCTYKQSCSLGNHNFVEMVSEDMLESEATCTKKATYRKSCSFCNEKSTLDSDIFEYGDALGHDYLITDTEHVCQRCDAQGMHTFVPLKGEEANFNGFSVCSECGGYQYQAATLVDNGTSDIAEDDYYAIYNASQLYWFADQFNNHYREDLCQNVKLMNDIVVNENVLTEDGFLNGDGSNFIPWTPINVKRAVYYEGTFDGNHHTISGLYCMQEKKYASIILWYRNSEIKNLGIVDSFFEGDNASSILASTTAKGNRLVDCYSEATVKAYSDYDIDCITGLATRASYLTLENCYFSGKILGVNNENPETVCLFVGEFILWRRAYYKCI